MSLSKCASAALSPVHPPLGTLIDGHSLELVEVLGVGGYGVVYRAVDTDPLSLTGHLKSYAVKCLISSPNASSRQRHVHIREIALHQLASVHPGVVTLHRVIEHQNATYIIMDYAPDHDLFTQILRNCRYLGNDDLIKHIFLQLLDAVEYCHLLGIYHRDLKPENVLCFDGGLRVAITDFGLATTEKMSDEFRTGSVYHMSPECQGGEFAPDGYYSPQANDVWSLGIVLLNLATGRNPWKSATVTDPTFQAYLHDPQSFLPSVLPISYAANELLLRMLDVNWRTRMTLPEVRRAIKMVDTFYCDGVIFEGSMARCPWEASMELDEEEEEIVNDVDERAVNEWRKKAGVYSVDESSSSSGSSSSSEEDYGATEDSRAIAESLAGIPPQSTKSAVAPAVTPTSEWSADSDTSQIIFASNSHTSSMGVPWTDFTSSKATWGCESSMSSICRPTTYGYSSDIEFPFDSIDPNNHRYPSLDISEGENIEYQISATEYRTDDTSVTKVKPGLKLDTHLDVLRDGASIGSVSSASSDTMQTAHEYENYSSSSIYFLADSSVLPKSPIIPLSASISADSSTYEDPSSFLQPSEHISQLLTPLKDAIMASPSTAEDPWPSKPLARASFSGISSPSRYSVASVVSSPLDTKWSDAEPQEEPKEISLSPIPSREGSWNTLFHNASVRTGGIRSPFYTFCRSSAPSPEESALRLTAQKSTELFEAPSGEAWAFRASDESQPTFPIDDHAKLTSGGDTCFSSSRPVTESPQQSSPSLTHERLEPKRFPQAELEDWQQNDDERTPMRAKSGRSSALFNAVRFLSKAGSPTFQRSPPRPHTSDSIPSAKSVGSPSAIQKTLSSTEASPCTIPPAETEATPPPIREHSPVRRWLSTKSRSPVRAGTAPNPQPRNQLMSRIQHRRATIHIGPFFRGSSDESEHPSVIFSSLAAAAGAASSSTPRSPLSTPEATVASTSSSSMSPPSTPSRAASPIQIASPDVSGRPSPAPSSFQLIPLPSMKITSPPAPARNRRWTVSGWTKGRSSEVQGNAPAHGTIGSLQNLLHLAPDDDRSGVARQQNEGHVLQGNRRRRGWLPNLLGRGSGTGFSGIDLHKVVKMPIEAADKWLGSLSGGSSRSKSGNAFTKAGVVV